MNMGASPILLDKYTVIDPGQRRSERRPPRIARHPARRHAAATRRARSAASTATAASIATCEHVETPVEILLYNFVTKELVRGDARCPAIDSDTG